MALIKRLKMIALMSGLLGIINSSSLDQTHSDNSKPGIAMGNYTGYNSKSNDVAIIDDSGKVQVWLYEPKVTTNNLVGKNGLTTTTVIREDSWRKYMEPTNSAPTNKVIIKARESLGL